jgi:hypothetical protein
MTVEFEPVHSIAWCHAEEEILMVVGAEKWNYSYGRRANKPLPYDWSAWRSVSLSAVNA